MSIVFVIIEGIENEPAFNSIIIMITAKSQIRGTLLTILIGAVGGVAGYLLQIIYTAIVIPFIQKVLPSIQQEFLDKWIILQKFFLNAALCSKHHP